MFRQRPVETRAERDAFFADQFQGLAFATGELASTRLARVIWREGRIAVAMAPVIASRVARLVMGSSKWRDAFSIFSGWT